MLTPLAGAVARAVRPATSSTTAEDRLVALACGIAARREAKRDAMVQLARRTEPTRLWTALERHHLTALAGTRLAEAGALPDVLEASVHRRLEQNRMRSIFYGVVARRALEQLAAAGIRALPLKGYALADDVHADPGYRRYGDIDILVPKERLRDAAAALAAVGYEPLDRPEVNGLPELHLELVDPTGHQPVLELHWRVHWIEDAFSAGMLARSRTVDGRERAQPADELAALLLFFARDGFVGLRLAADIAAWYDARHRDMPPRPLDALAAAHPELAATWWTALCVAQHVVGVPADKLMSPVRTGARERLAGRLANWSGEGDEDQTAADVTLVNVLLSPREQLPSMVRQYLFVPRTKLDEFYGLPPEAHARRAGWRMLHPVKMLARYALGVWRSRDPAASRPPID